MNFLPISLNIQDRNCLVVGGGNIAIRKSRQLLSAGAIVTVVAPEFHSDFIQQAAEGLIELIYSEYSAEQLAGMQLVIAATDNTETNRQVHCDAELACVLVNVVDQPKLCRFIVPSIIDRKPLSIAISTGGSGPVFARMLREKLEWLIPENIGEFLEKVNKDRTTVAQKHPDMSERELGWKTADNLSNSNKSLLNLEYQLYQTDKLPRIAKLILIDFGRADISDLSVSMITQLQKVDNLYISQKSYRQLKNLIRRDADIHILDKTLLELAEVTELLDSHTLKDTRTVVLNEGHLFEQFEAEISSLMTEKKPLEYVRLGIAKYC